ncbi:MAG: PEP/pyruvate-binding domain-containing protein [Patescibacteria group bacterium]
MEFIKQFTELGSSETAIAGGKGASLGEMTRSGIPVPPGFVILSSAYEHFLSHNGLDLKIDSLLRRINLADTHSLESVSQEIRSMIENASIPDDLLFEVVKNFILLEAPHVAVRSSATSEDSIDASWAGQLESYLNTTERTMLKHMRRCWASLFTPRAIAYRREKGLHEKKISVAVVVQKMIASDSAGIAFSVHPVTEDMNQLLAEAAFGLGEPIVSGSITPDSYIVGKDPRRVIQINIAEKHQALVRSVDSEGNELTAIKEPKAYEQVLNNAQILELTNLVVAIEKHYGFPCDVEWALENGKFYILQSRPITTLTKKERHHFHYTATDVGILHHDVMLSLDGYGAFDYRILIESGVVRGYLSDAGMEQAREHGEKLLDEDFFKKIVERAARVHTSLIEYQRPAVGAVALQEWERLLSLCKAMWSIYTYCDQPMQSTLEDMVLKKKPDSDYAQHVLETMGKIKLELHASAENIFTNGFDTFAELLELKFKITRDEFYALTQHEVREALKGKAPPVENARARLRGCVFVRKQNSWQCLTGDEFRKWKEVIEQGQPKDIVGTVAFPGKATGRVVKHLSWTAITNIPAGSILVTGMTNPQMIPYIKNAAAIVTDEGGLTCHAAIISREWKIPCVVGTKVATQLLRDGDLVQVDANAGLVTVLEKSP